MTTVMQRCFTSAKKGHGASCKGRDHTDEVKYNALFELYRDVKGMSTLILFTYTTSIDSNSIHSALRCRFVVD